MENEKVETVEQVRARKQAREVAEAFGFYEAMKMTGIPEGLEEMLSEAATLNEAKRLYVAYKLGTESGD